MFRLELGAVCCIIALLLLRPSCCSRLSVVFKEILLTHGFSYHERSVLTQGGVDRALSKHAVVPDP